MNEIDLAEFHSREAAKFSLDGLSAARARAHALLLVLLSGGAGLGSVALTQWGSAVAWAALGASVWWFCIGAYLALYALRTAMVRGWASTTVLSQHADWVRCANEVAHEGGQKPDPVALTRVSLIKLTADAAGGYRDASTAAFLALDRACLAMAITPLWCVSAAALSLVLV